MEDIYREYRNTLMNKGPYRAYFESRASYRESPRKFTKTYSGEHSPVSEPERKEQPNEIKPDKATDAKTEIRTENKNEQSQKIETKQDSETSQKIEKQTESSETRNELSNEKVGSPYSYEKKTEQTDITKRDRPSPYYDRAESRW